MSDCVNCGGSGDNSQALTESQSLAVFNKQLSNADLNPVLGPYLGGGFSGSYLGSGVGRVGGGLTPPVHLAASPDPNASRYEPVRHDFRFDYSTPTMIFQRDRFTDPALNRELGGIVGGEVW